MAVLMNVDVQCSTTTGAYLGHGTGAEGNYEDATMTCIRALSYCRYYRLFLMFILRKPSGCNQANQPATNIPVR